MANPKVLITGASGLIGGLVIERLSEKYDFSALNRSNIEGIPLSRADISNIDEILPAFEVSLKSHCQNQLLTLE